MKYLIIIILVALFAGCNTPDPDRVTINIDPTVLRHSHNDYSSRAPLYGALEAGCQIVEVDVVLSLSGKIVLAHGATWYTTSLLHYGHLESKYLRPMREICEDRGYDLYLFIELKDGSPAIKDILGELLRKYQTPRLHYLLGGWDFDGAYPDRPVLYDAIMEAYGFDLNIVSSDAFFAANVVETIDLPQRILK